MQIEKGWATRPVVTRKGQEYCINGPNCYRDELCGRIGRKVTEVITDDADTITIRFDDGTAFMISRKSEHREGAETGYFASSRDPREPLLDF